MNSIRVVGRIPPAPLQSTCWEVQSPVLQVKRPLVMLVQWDRSQTLSNHEAGTLIVVEPFDANLNPIDDNGCDPLSDNVVGQIVDGQLFLIVNIAD